MRWQIPIAIVASAFQLGCMQTGHLQRGDPCSPTVQRERLSTAAVRAAEPIALATYEQPPEPVVRNADHPEPLPEPDAEALPELPSAVVELWELEEMALASNPAIAVARARIQALYGQWVQAGIPPNPVVGYSGQQLGSHGEAEQQGVLIGQEWITGKKLRLDRQVAAQEWAQAEQELAMVQTRVITDVRLNFYELVVAQRQVKLAEQLLDVGERGVRAAEALLAAKETSRLDTLQLTVERDSAQLLLINARNRSDAAWRQLAASVGQPNLPRAMANDDLALGPPVEWEHALERIKSQSPEIAAAISNIERARWALTRAEAEVIPNVSVEGVVQHDNATGSSNGNLQVSVPVPVWNRNQGGVQQAYGELAAAEQELQRVELRLERQLATVYERYLSALQQAERYERDILPKAEESLELVRRGYEAGEFDYLRLLTAQRTYFQTSGTYLDALREWKMAEAEIDGLLLQGALEAANNE